ncbi:hypothetical protein LAZ67_22000808 [Cordylochernes scorpioides]|uniref:Endonuclease n=1 Tax=Cordylochernes scorpioides TaxID=51811 RepID=A0ABY6LNL5_9ARAC|nr:hypothetical protein LAZ67_22000808 [Cordylochernes scorpioides]
MLVEVYVRDLITIILENAYGRKTTSFSTLYVRLSSQLRALGYLGVTTDKCAAILYPMVESTLPEDLFVAWERTRHHHKPDEDAKHKSSEVLLEKLMEFLKHEVEGSERMRLARQPFSSSYLCQSSKINGENKSKVVRAMLDSGSQNSYVLEQTASEVGLTMLGKKEVVHLLFGGVKSRPQQHKRYRIYISDVDSKYNCNFEVQDCSTICSAMPSAQPAEWMTELRSKGIDLDVYRSNTEIELLLGADVYAKLLTGKKIELESGPVALETKLGWTVSGKVLENVQTTESQSSVLSCLVRDATIQDLWRLDVIGIMEPMKEKSKEDYQSTPVRPVFNASFRTKGNPSLNDCLEVGPNMLENIPDIITRFRLGPVAVTSDIRKAFLQIEVAEEDRNYLQFWWYKNQKLEEKQMYRNCRVVFGVSNEYKKTIDILRRSMYVDNCVASVGSKEDALRFKEESVEIFGAAKMDLREWEISPSSEEKQVPVLGLFWNLRTDELTCDLRSFAKKMEPGKVTRRKILSAAHSLFDPIGFTCPFTIIPKMLLQESYGVKAGWDTDLSEDISRRFNAWLSWLTEVDKLKIPRCVVQSQDRRTWTLHIFMDSSNAAFAACAYLRSGFPGSVQVQLLMARSRVAPMKNTTIPRLELVACEIRSRLAVHIKSMMEFEDIPITLWTDSTTALAWIKRDMNCITDWRHVPGKENPADIPSRGASISQLITTRWWERPVWLKKEEQFWTQSVEKESIEEVNSELRKAVVTHFNIEKRDMLAKITQFSNYHKILRMVAYWRRFLDWLQRKRSNKITKGPITMEEMTLAEEKVIRLGQQCSFEGVKDKKFKNLRVYEDESGLLQVKCRFVPVEKVDAHSYPIVMPSNGVTGQLIWSYHRLMCHAGVQSLHANLQERYWILNSRRTIRNEIRPCARCRRFRAQPCYVEEGPLPKDRVRVGPAFDVTGVDMTGRLHLKGNKKYWIAIFTCATYRAIHLELCTSLTTETFIGAMRRFVARRGRPSTIYSDNGLNFVGCKNLFSSLDWNKIVEYGAINRISWKFNPPTACCWGGFWERMIWIVKQLLGSVLGSARVTNEELQTVLCDVEAVMNNRPLTNTALRFLQLGWKLVTPLGYWLKAKKMGYKPKQTPSKTFKFPPKYQQRIFQGLITTLQLVERLDRYPLRNKRKIDSVEPEETSMNVKKEGTQVSNYVVQHLPRNPSIFSGEDGEDLQKWLKGYARVAKYNHWDETLCLTKVYFYLSGTALKWFENNEESIQTWKEFTSQLENVFGKKENSRLQAEKKLKTRAQLKGESTECYIQDLLCLCKEVDPQMSEEDKISHLMKGIAEELYQALLPRDVQSTEQFITECRRVEALRCRRVTPTRYERLPNVASLCDQDDGEDLSSMIRQIVREEVQRALGSPRAEPKNATIEEIVKEEIGRSLAPISKSRRSPPQKEKSRQFLNTRYEAETIRPHPEPRYPKQGGRRDTNVWRTTEGRPICFYCERPGHVVRYCRDRKRHNEERRNDYFQRKQDAMVSYNSRAESQDPNDESSRKTFTRYRSPTSYRGRNRQHFSPARRSSWTPRH